MRAVVGLGTNLGDRMQNLQNALAAIDRVVQTQVVRCSRVYESKPYGYTDQADFLNMAAELETKLQPEALLGALLGIEAGLGRVRTIKNGPRVIDLDLLSWEGVTSDTPFLRLPHPGLWNRSFVLLPLADLYPNGNALGVEFAQAARALPKDDIRLFADRVPVFGNED